MEVMLEYNITSIVLATISFVGFFLLYNKTAKIPFLFMGLAVYLKLLFCSFGLLSEYVFAIPEFILILWLVLEFRFKIKWIISIIIAFSVFYVLWVWYAPYHIMGIPALSIMILWSLWYIHTSKKNSRKSPKKEGK
jgi:hypothetical protein